LIECFDKTSQVFSRFDRADEENEISIDPETPEEFGVFSSFED